MNAKRFMVYMCPICKKEYKRKGKYLSAHLHKCNAIAWIPNVRYEITMNRFNADMFIENLEIIASGNFSVKGEPIDRIKKSNERTNLNVDLDKLYAYKEVMTELKDYFKSNERMYI